MLLKIITPQGIILERHVEEVRVPTELGEVGILEGHIPYVALINKGMLYYRSAQDREKFLVEPPGFIQVGSQGEVAVLVNSAVQIVESS